MFQATAGTAGTTQQDYPPVLVGGKEGKRKTVWVSWRDMTKPKCMGGLEFRDFELFNLSLLARQSWRLLTCDNSLCARVMKAVYYPNRDILSAELGSHPSLIWRSVLEGRDIMRQGLIRRIGNGRTTSIWGHNWIPREINMLPLARLRSHGPNLVAELIDE